MSIEYLAGLFDGEGSFCFQVVIRDTIPRKDGTKKGTRSVIITPRVTMKLYKGWEKVFPLYQEFFEGKIYETKKGREWQWSIQDRKRCLKMAIAIQPYLKIKQDICSRFIEAIEMFPPLTANKRLGDRDWTPELTNKVAYIALTLNPETARKSPKTLEYLEELQKIYE
jgi:hypothetical protein